jgi:hypothetical protein
MMMIANIAPAIKSTTVTLRQAAERSLSILFSKEFVLAERAISGGFGGGVSNDCESFPSEGSRAETEAAVFRCAEC